MKHGRPFFLKKKAPKKKRPSNRARFFRGVHCLMAACLVWLALSLFGGLLHSHRQEDTHQRKAVSDFQASILFLCSSRNRARGGRARKSKQASKQAEQDRPTVHLILTLLDPSVTDSHSFSSTTSSLMGKENVPLMRPQSRRGGNPGSNCSPPVPGLPASTLLLSLSYLPQDSAWIAAAVSRTRWRTHPSSSFTSSSADPQSSESRY